MEATGVPNQRSGKERLEIERGIIQLPAALRIGRQQHLEPSVQQKAVDAIRALSLMQSTGNSRLMVVQDGRLVGIISLKDLLKFFALKVDLEGMG